MKKVEKQKESIVVLLVHKTQNIINVLFNKGLMRHNMTGIHDFLVLS